MRSCSITWQKEQAEQDAVPRQADDYTTALEITPECAHRIAIVLSLYVEVEHGLAPILSWTTGLTLDQAQAALALQKQNARKVLFLKGVCEQISPEWPRDVIAGKLFAQAIQAGNRIRNKYAHATYVSGGTPDAELLYVAVFADTAIGEEIATVEILDSEIHYMKSLIVAMHNYIAARAENAPVNLREIEDVVANAPQPFLRPSGNSD